MVNDADNTGEPPVPRCRRWMVVGLLMAAPLLGALVGAMAGAGVGAEVVEAGSLWRAGHVPLWSEARGLGRPLVGDGGSWVFYPSVLLYGWMDERWAWAMDAFVHIAVAGLGVWALAKRAGWAGKWSVAAGMVAQVIVAVLVGLDVRVAHAAALLPWVLVGVMGLARRPTVWRVIGVMLLMLLVMLAGRMTPALAVIGVAGVMAMVVIVRAPYCCIEMTRWGRARALPLLVVSFVGAVLLAGVHWVPRVYLERLEEREKLAAESREWLATLPRIWTVRAAQTAELPGDARRRIANKLADPKIVVVLDRQIDEHYAHAEQLTPNLLRRPDNSRREPMVEVVEDRPGMLRVKVRNPSGWLVVSAAYAHGWRGRLEATSVSRRGEKRVVDREAVVMPAYGVLRAMPLASLGGDEVEAEMRYWPVGWRRGVVVSALGAVLLMLMVGWGLMKA